MKETLFTISSRQREQIESHLRAEIEREPAVKFAYLYGSVLDSDRVHDIDVGIYLQEGAVAQGAGIAELLALRLTAKLGIPVDVRTLNEAPLSFQYHALRGILLVCRDEEFLTGMIEDVPRRYLDSAPLVRQSTKDAFAA